MNDIQYWEEKLDSFDYEERWNAFLKLVEKARKGEIILPPPSPRVNLHFHTFFSFNAYGYSPLHVIWKAKELGLSMAEAWILMFLMQYLNFSEEGWK